MIDYDLFKNIENYANLHLESSYSFYKSLNQNTNKLFYYILRGKIAEWCCYFYLKNLNYILNEPDMKIYKENKTFDADLVIDGKDNVYYLEKIYLHVKSVKKSNYEKYGPAFLIEKNDPIVTSPKKNHFFAVMLQKSLTDYELYKKLDVRSVKYINPEVNLPTKWKVSVDSQ